MQRNLFDSGDRAIRPADPNAHPEAHARLTRQSREILDLLKQGPQTNLTLLGIAQRFGARLHDIRKAGYDVDTKLTDPQRGIYTYTLVP
jgi:DNA-binding CsgD family transcriptional regulator